MSALGHRPTFRPSLDHLIGDLLEMHRHVEAQRLSGFEVDNKLILRRRLYRHERPTLTDNLEPMIRGTKGGGILKLRFNFLRCGRDEALGSEPLCRGSYGIEPAIQKKEGPTFLACSSPLFFHQVVNAAVKHAIVDQWYPSSLSIIF
jgi:hypothetical protein